MKLKTVDLELDNGVIKIAGKNMAGKSTVLKLIEALGGKNNMPEQPLKDGERKGFGELHLGDESGTKYIVTYSLTPRDTYLKVESADGEKIGSPAKLLTSFLSDLVDPWRFVRMASGDTTDRKKACKILKELMIVEFNCGVYLEQLGYGKSEFLRSLVAEHADDPFSFLKALDDALCENRKEWKKARDKTDALVKSLKSKVPPEQRDATPIDISALIAKRDSLKEMMDDHTHFLGAIEREQRKIKEWEKEIAASKERIEEVEAQLESLKPASQDEIDEFDEQISNANELQEMARNANELKEEAAKLEKKEARVELLDDKIEEVREQVETLRENAHMPVDNMRVEGDKIMLNGLPFTQASRREQLCASIDVAMALEPMLNVFVCHDASLLDAEGLAIIDEKQKEYGSQVLLEVVQDEGGSGVIFVEDDEAVNT